MNWESEGYLLSKNKFRENASIINVFTNLHGKVSGIVYGGNSRKIKNFLQIGNKIHLINTSKNPNKIGYFKTEIIEPISAKYFNDKKRTTAIICITTLLNTLLPESQKNKFIYQSLGNLLSKFDLDQWIILYIFWELNLIKELGYDTELEKYQKHQNIEDEFISVKIDNTSYEIPYFLIKKEIPLEISNKLIKRSLEFTKKVLIEKFYNQNNLKFPISRNLLEKYFT
tara:strand:- start:177 stop:857 length:681 start_codon:yes stop_codon:yes gene_type:complete